MKKKILITLYVLLFSTGVYAQQGSGVEKLIETERAFAAAAESKGVKAAFLEYLADEGIVFNPAPVNGKELWRNRPDSPASLKWYPVFADISSNGALGYTTGPGEYRPKGKDDSTVYNTEYFTIWQKQPDGNYRAVLDLGISHGAPASADTGWKSPPANSGNSDLKKMPASSAAQRFFEMAEAEGLAKAYKLSAAEDLRLLREGDFPFVGKAAALERVKKDKGTIKFSKRMFFVGAGDLAYLSDTYTLTKDKTNVEKGTLAQVWKLRNGNWELVFDVFEPIPQEKK
jgi:hypothetical protein